MLRGQCYLSWALASVGFALLALSIMLSSNSQVLAAEGQAQCDGPNACNTTKCLDITDCTPNDGPRSLCKSGSNCDGCKCKKNGNQCQCKG